MQAGRSACIHSFRGRTELNGAAVTLIEWLNDKERWSVRVNATGEMLQVLQSRLHLQSFGKVRYHIAPRQTKCKQQNERFKVRGYPLLCFAPPTCGASRPVNGCWVVLRAHPRRPRALHFLYEPRRACVLHVPLCMCVLCLCCACGESASRPARVRIRGGMRRALIRWLAVCGRARGHCDQVRDIGPGRSSGEYPMAILIIWSFDILALQF